MPSFKKDFIDLFLENGEGREKEGERNTDVREKQQSVVSCASPTRDRAPVCPQPATRPVTQACSLSPIQQEGGQPTELQL